MTKQWEQMRQMRRSGETSKDIPSTRGSLRINEQYPNMTVITVFTHMRTLLVLILHTGLLASAPLNSSLNASRLVCDLNTCAHGYCINEEQGAKCTCYSGWTGDRCDEDIDECTIWKNSACFPGSACLNTLGSYECICQEGRKGLMCEMWMGYCNSDRSCLNGGRCIERRCHCASDFVGPKCAELEYEDICATYNPCMDHQQCVLNKTIKSGYSCECPAGFEGHYCDTAISNSEKRDTRTCTNDRCAKLAFDGICHQECNTEACTFDGGDCAAGTVPFSRCPHAAYCAERYFNGKCDGICNSEDCLLDGGDCNEKVEWLQSEMVFSIFVPVSPASFVSKVDTLLSRLSQILNISVRIHEDIETGLFDVFEWDSKRGLGQRVRFGSKNEGRKLPDSSNEPALNSNKDSLMGIVAYFEFDLWEDGRENLKQLFILLTEVNGMKTTLYEEIF